MTYPVPWGHRLDTPIYKILEIYSIVPRCRLTILISDCYKKIHVYISIGRELIKLFMSSVLHNKCYNFDQSDTGSMWYQPHRGYLIVVKDLNACYNFELLDNADMYIYISLYIILYNIYIKG